MKAVDYFNHYGSAIFNEAAKGKHDSMLLMFDEVYAEIDAICKTRNAVRDSAKVSAVKEINQKWNKIRDLSIKQYTASPIKKDAIMTVFLKKNPSYKRLFIVERTPKKFEPSDAQKEFDNMSQTSKFLVTMAMLGAAVRGTTGESYSKEN